MKFFLQFMLLLTMGTVGALLTANMPIYAEYTTIMPQLKGDQRNIHAMVLMVMLFAPSLAIIAASYYMDNMHKYSGSAFSMVMLALASPLTAITVLSMMVPEPGLNPVLPALITCLMIVVGLHAQLHAYKAYRARHAYPRHAKTSSLRRYA